MLFIIIFREFFLKFNSFVRELRNICFVCLCVETCGFLGFLNFVKKINISSLVQTSKCGQNSYWWARKIPVQFSSNDIFKIKTNCFVKSQQTFNYWEFTNYSLRLRFVIRHFFKKIIAWDASQACWADTFSQLLVEGAL